MAGKNPLEWKSTTYLYTNIKNALREEKVILNGIEYSDMSWKIWALIQKWREYDALLEHKGINPKEIRTQKEINDILYK